MSPPRASGAPCWGRRPNKVEDNKLSGLGSISAIFHHACKFQDLVLRAELSIQMHGKAISQHHELTNSSGGLVAPVADKDPIFMDDA